MFSHSELVLNSRGGVYHLDLLPEEIGETVLLVGDQNRVSLVAAQLDNIVYTGNHREFFTVTGTSNGAKISVISTGIGTDNIDIVVNELDALVNIDLKNRVPLAETNSLRLIRIGTCGILQKKIPIHEYILSVGALGLDNLAHFYDLAFSSQESTMAEAFSANFLKDSALIPYYKTASDELYKTLFSAETHSGITLTAPGFYGPQGRQLRLTIKPKDLLHRLENQKLEEIPLLNFEMECSALFALGQSLGHQTATICLGVANRSAGQFSTGYQSDMEKLIAYVLDRLTRQ